jgi:hypothetical protein
VKANALNIPENVNSGAVFKSPDVEILRQLKAKF